MSMVKKCAAGFVIALVGLTFLRANDLPQVPQEIRELMRDRKYDHVVSAIDNAFTDQETKPRDPEYLRYLKGRAQHLGGKYREALETFAQLELDYPAGKWLRRARFGQASALLKLGDFEAAEHIYEQEVRFLLSTERKHEIASIYLEFADAYFNPPAKDRKPDYQKALNFYKQALAVGPNGERRVDVEYRVARCHQELGQFAEAAAAYQSFLKIHPQSQFDIDVRFELGKTQLAQKQNVEARRTWKDLLSSPRVAEKPERAAEAAYEIAHTYGLPAPSSAEDLELGVAAAEKFIANYPEHKLAPKAAFEIAQGYVAQNRQDEAIRTLQKLIGNPHFEKSEELPDARVLLGFSYQRQQKFPEAIAAWREYLTRHPAHSSWAEVQQAIVETEFLTALEARREGSRQAAMGDRQQKFTEARTLWEAFLAKYPLDGRAPSIMLEFGLMSFELGELLEKSPPQRRSPDDAGVDPTPDDQLASPTAESMFTSAIADWTQLVSKYPTTEESSRGQYLIGLTYEQRLAKFDEALAAYRKVTWGQFAPRAQERIAQLTRQQLIVVTERVFRTDQQPCVKVTTRNIRQLTVKAYRVDMETYFRKMHLASGIESLDIALIDPEKSWTFEIPEYADYKELVSQIDVPLESPGVMAVTVSNEPVPLGQTASLAHLKLFPQEATTMVVLSDLDVLVKCSRNELFVFAENLHTGKPFPGVKLLISDGNKVFAEGTTNADGVFIGAVSDADKTWEPLKTSNDVRVFAWVEGSGIASNVVGLQGIEFAQGISSKGYLYTERPTYRPGQLVHVRGVVRWVKGDEYFFEDGRKFKLDVYDSRGRQIRGEEVVLGEFGSFATRFVIPPGSPQGEYRLHAHDPAEPDRHNYQGTFTVHEFQLQSVTIAIDTPKRVYMRGEEISGVIKLRYYYGLPVSHREIRYTLPDGTIHTADTDAAGEVAFKLDTREFREDQTLTIQVLYPELNLASGQNLFLATRAFRASVSTARDVFIAGETFDVTVATTDVAGKKTGQEMRLAIVKRTEVESGHRLSAVASRAVGERTVQELPITTDQETGTGRATIKIAEPGTYVLRASGADQFGNPVSTERTITVSGDSDTVRLRILADRHHYKAGDTATVQIHWREQPALALVTFQGARVLDYRLVELATGSNNFEFPVSEKLAPNFDLTVSVMLEEGNRRLAVGGGVGTVAGSEESLTGLMSSQLPSFHETSSPFEVDRPLVVTIKPARENVLPGEEVVVEIMATDSQGRPVRAELSVAMIEKSLLDMFPDQRASITQFFEGTRRVSALRSVASCTFRYVPRTRAISETLIAEAERALVLELERHSRELDRNGDALGVTVLRGATAPAEEEGVPRSVFDEEMGERFGVRFNVSGGAGIMGGFGAGAAGRPGTGTGAYGPAGQSLGRVAPHRSTVSGRGLPRSLEELDQVGEAAAPGSWANARYKLEDFDGTHPFYSQQLNAESLGRLARHQAQGEFRKEAGRKTLGLLLQDGSVNYLSANAVAEGKLPALVNAGVTLLSDFQIRETGYWNPSVTTDEEGRARITVTVPDRSTAWQFNTRGITTGTLTGGATAELVSKKDLFGELKLPAAFVDGDSAQIQATVHNDTVARGKIEVTLKTTIGGKSRDESRTIEVTDKGTHELVFDREISGPGDAVFELGVKAVGAPVPLEDTTRSTVPIRPYGLPVFATAGGSANSNMTAWVSPPSGMPLRDTSLEILIGPSVERSLLDVVLGSGTHTGQTMRYRDFLICESPLERITSDLMAAVSLIKRMESAREHGSPESAALADRVRSSVSFVLSSQNEDGGWHWSAASGTNKASDRNSSARVVWALARAREAGFAVPDDCWTRAITFIQTAFVAARENDYDGKTLLLHALSLAGRADFAFANRLYRSRQSLSPLALGYLSLAFVELDRKEIARELVDMLAPKIVEAPSPTGPRGISAQAAEVRALYLIALNAVAPGDSKGKAVAEWLMAHRVGPRWQPERVTGPAVIGLANYFGSARLAAEHYQLKVFVNDHQVADLDFDGAAGTRLVEVPREVLARGEKLPERDFPGGEARRQRVNFELTGRGQFTFHCLYGGFVAADQLQSTTQAWHIERYYEPAPLELDGRQIPRGFDLLAGSFNTWRNPVTELPVGQRAEVHIHLWRTGVDQLPDDQLDYLVVTEPIPSGCTVLEKSISGSFDRYELGPGTITFYVGNQRHPGEIRFDVYGYTAGKFRSAPTFVRSFYEPERIMVTEPKPLTILPAGQRTKDEYRLTPRELYEFGKRLIAKENYGQAGQHLTELFDKFPLKPEIYKEVAQLLLDVSLHLKKAPAIVRYFEVLKEKWPDLEIPFEQIVQVGAAYRELNEYERSYLVFRATAEGSFARESEIGGFLEQQGEFERSIATMDRLLREYPAEPYIASATYALAQRVYAMAPNAATDAKLREHRVTKIDLIRDAVGRIDDFLTVWPDDPAADQASFSIASALVELENWPSAIARCERFVDRYPKSQYLDSFWYIIGYSHFARGEHRDALDMCKRVAEATRTDPATGRVVESQNKWRAIYIRGQVFHSLGQPAQAIAEYERVADRFPDAKETIAHFTRKAIELPEKNAVSSRQLAVGEEEGGGGNVELPIKFRNIASCELKVYRIDLMKFGLLQRDLANITKVNLAGIRPLYETKVELGDGKDYEDRTKLIDLPLKDEGAYLVVCRGEDLHASGLVLVTPLAIEVQEEQTSGRVRTMVKNMVTDKYVADVQVKVIGARNDVFQDGRTDLRGVFVADGILGRSTVIARAADGQYAFHRGQIDLGPPARAPKPEAAKSAQPEPQADLQRAPAQQELLMELFESNRAIQQQKGKELQDLYEKKLKGIQPSQAF